MPKIPKKIRTLQTKPATTGTGLKRKRESDSGDGKVLKKKKVDEERSIVTKKDTFTPRRSTRKATKESKRNIFEYCKTENPPKKNGHINAKGRAAIHDPESPTTDLNQKTVESLRLNKAYKQGTYRVHFKGERLLDGRTTGNRLGGKKVERKNWSSNQKRLNEKLDAHLEEKHGDNFQKTPHRGGEHGTEVAHVRAQSAGGVSDPLGAQPASVHYNIEDMAREEGQQTLHKKYGDQVRMKSTVYVHPEGTVIDGQNLSGSVKARRHKILFQDPTDQHWGVKFDHLQDGFRNTIDTEEVTALKNKVASLTPSSPNVDLHPEIDRTAKPRKSTPPTPSDSDQLKEVCQKIFEQQAEHEPKITNYSPNGPYFTDLRSPSGDVYTGDKAAKKMEGILSTHAPPRKPKKKK